MYGQPEQAAEKHSGTGDVSRAAICSRIEDVFVCAGLFARDAFKNVR